MINLDSRLSFIIAAFISIAFLSLDLHPAAYASMFDMAVAVLWFGLPYGMVEAVSLVSSMTMTGQKYLDEIIVPYVIPTVHLHALIF